MRRIPLVIALLLVPAAASAQSAAGALDAPVEGALPTPASYQRAEVAPVPAPPGEPTSAATEPRAELSSEAQPRWPSQPVTGVDPEILALRSGASGERAAAPRTHYRVIERYRAPEAQTDGGEGPDVGASFGHAAGGFGIGAAAGVMVGGGITLALTCGPGDGGLCFVFGMLGGGFGAGVLGPFGAALGAWGFGEQSGGTGNFFAALGGAYLGAGAGVGLAALLAASGEAGFGGIFGPAVGVVLSMLGAAGGYQLSSRGSRSSGARADVAPQVLPTLAPTADGQGATVGAVGTF